MDSVSEDSEEPIHDLVPFLGIDFFGQIHRALHVGEEDGYLLALAFEGAARGEDLLGKVRRLYQACVARGAAFRVPRILATAG